MAGAVSSAEQVSVGMGAAQQDLYAVLGVSPTATDDEITHAYRQLVRRHHPDSRDADADAAGADAALLDVLGAYAVLHHPQLRADYDRRHGHRPASTPARQPAPPRTPGPATRRRPGKQSEPPLRVGPLHWER